MEAILMDNFNDGFKQSNFPKKRNLNNFLTPFLSGVVGASLVVGVCFGVPEVKSKLVNSRKQHYFFNFIFFKHFK